MTLRARLELNGRTAGRFLADILSDICNTPIRPEGLKIAKYSGSYQIDGILPEVTIIASPKQLSDLAIEWIAGRYGVEDDSTHKIDVGIFETFTCDISYIQIKAPISIIRNLQEKYFETALKSCAKLETTPV